MLKDNSSDQGLFHSAERYAAELQRIKTPGQLYAFLNSRSQHSFHRRRKIPVQPTSIARRSASSTRGSARHRSGRPLAVLGKTGRPSKRPRLLGLAVSENRPNAKSHGEGH